MNTVIYRSGGIREQLLEASFCVGVNCLKSSAVDKCSDTQPPTQKCLEPRSNTQHPAQVISLTMRINVALRTMDWAWWLTHFDALARSAGDTLCSGFSMPGINTDPAGSFNPVPETINKGQRREQSNQSKQATEQESRKQRIEANPGAKQEVGAIAYSNQSTSSNAMGRKVMQVKQGTR